VIDESTDPRKAEAIQKACTLDARFHYIHPPTRIGLPASLNLGLSMANGSLIARFDSDDICLPDRLKLQVEFLDNHPEIGIVGGSVEIIDDSGKTQGIRSYPQTHHEIFSKMMLTNAMAHPTVTFRKAISDTRGSYDETFRFSEDLELWLRWLNCGVAFANLPQILVKYRQQETRRNPLHWSFNLQARRRHFTSQYFFRRLLGIAAVSTWTLLPARLQESLFRMLIFKSKEH
jgi:glycosyltransferase involved in cell wall biosynthesis